MTIRTDSMLLEPGSEVKLYSLDGTSIHPEAGTLNFHGYREEGNIVWQGVEYTAWPIEAKGFEKSGDKQPSPTLSVGNIDGSVTALCLQFDDMVGAILTRKRTLTKYLDAVNFPGGVNASANPGEMFPDEKWYIDRKETEDHTVVRWSLSTAMDFNGVALPRRLIVANQCYWKYRDGDCGYAGPPVAKRDDTPTSDPALDDCSKRVSGCKLRFGADQPLPYGSFPAAGLMR